MTKKILLLLAFVPFFATAQTTTDHPTKIKVFNGYSGGMMFHAGYLFGKNPSAPISPNGATIGIGGALRINLFKHWRIGGEGYVSTMNGSFTDCKDILKDGSYFRNGWGGFLTDVHWRFDRFWLYTGATIGGGAMKSLYIETGDNADWLPEERATLHKQSYFCVVPFVGFDYLLTPRIHATVKFDWQIAIHKQQLQYPTGPKLYVGILFCH